MDAFAGPSTIDRISPQALRSRETYRARTSSDSTVVLDGDNNRTPRLSIRRDWTIAYWHFRTSVWRLFDRMEMDYCSGCQLGILSVSK